jgi:hypothetical protein
MEVAMKRITAFLLLFVMPGLLFAQTRPTQLKPFALTPATIVDATFRSL